MAEYYIRTADSDEARGPFPVDKLQSLAEAGQVTPETLFYDDAAEAWKPLSESAELQAAIFPEKKKVGLRKKEKGEIKVLNKEDPTAKPLSVEQMLAAAEGATAETKHTKERQKWRERSAALAVPGLGVAMLLSALAHVVPNLDIIQRVAEDSDFLVLLREPLLLLGLFDLFIAICLFLAVTEIFALLRLRAMAGMGYFAFTYWAHWQNGDPSAIPLMVASLAAGTGLFLGSLTQSFVLMVIALVLAIGGAGVYGYLSFLA